MPKEIKNYILKIQKEYQDNCMTSEPWAMHILVDAFYLFIIIIIILFLRKKNNRKA